MAVQDPSIAEANNSSTGQLPQTTFAPTVGAYTAGGYAAGATTAVPGTGTFAPIPGATNPAPPPASGAPMDVGYNATVPGMGENVSASLLDNYATNGIPQNTNYAAQQYGQFQQQTPADMSGYYNNASRNLANKTNTEMAARGSYGSSNAVGVLQNGEMNLRAQQAKDEAGYGLSRAQLGGSLGASADSSGRANSADELNWVGGISDLAFKNQKEGAARYQQLFNNTLAGADRGAGIERDTGNNEINDQKQLLIQQIMAQTGATLDEATATANKVTADRGDEKDAVDGAKTAVTTIAMV